MDGVLVVDKPVGPSSHDVVVVARRALGIRRIGHTGTLDPQASGVLPLVLGQATRLAQYLTASDKEYEATLRFGLVTDTHDAAGGIVEQSGVVPSRADLESALDRFRGTFAQRPPVYSAKMIEGERSYALARRGTPQAAEANLVTVDTLTLVAFEPPRARLLVRCGAGFYVRALAHDLGQALGSGAILDGLVRTEAAGFRRDQAVAFAELVTTPRAELGRRALPLDALLPELPAVTLTGEGLQWVRHGRELPPRHLATPLRTTASLVRLMDADGRLIGLARPGKTPGFLHPAIVFSYN